MRRGKAETKDHEPPSKLAAFLLTFPKAEYKPALAMKILPLSVVFVFMITFNQLTLDLVEVSFYNVVRCEGLADSKVCDVSRRIFAMLKRQ